MFSRMVTWLKSVIGRFFSTENRDSGHGFEGQNVPVAVSEEMSNAIERWGNEYRGLAPWIVGKCDFKTLGLFSQIASEMAMLVCLESEINIDGSARAKLLDEWLEPLRESLQKETEYACAMGGIVFKPYLDGNGNGIAIDFVQADDFYPVAFNSRGEITSAIFVERKTVGKIVYSRVEHHIVSESDYCIINRCFKGYSDADVGTECSLSEIPEWDGIEPEVHIQNIDFPLFSYFKIPIGNNIDPKSPLGVSVYAKAESVIEEADRQYNRLMWEYEAGEMAIDANEDAFEIDSAGHIKLPEGKERLFRPNHFDPKNSTEDALFKVFAPSLRDESYKEGLYTLLERIEDQCMLARGTLAKPPSDSRTATEIKFSRQRSYATVTSIQKSLEKAIRNLLQAMDAMATLYGIAPNGTYEVSFKWDDSVVTDADTERETDRQDIRDGLMQKYEYRMKWYGEDEETAKRMVSEDQESEDEIMGFIRNQAASSRSNAQNAFGVNDDQESGRGEQ